MSGKEELKRAQSRDRKEKTLELLKNKYSIAQIANELQISTTTIHGYTRQLIQEGKITDDEIYKTPKGVRNLKIDRNSKEYISTREEIIKYLKLGWSTKAITKKIDITSFYMNLFMREIISKKILTSEEINEARVRKKEENLELLTRIINEGLTIKYYGELRPELSVSTISGYIKELIDAGKITREQINNNLKNAISKARLESVPMTIAEQQEFIIDKIKKGYSIPEIIKADKTGTLTRERVIKRKNELIATGLITVEDQDKAKSEHQKRKTEEKHDELINTIKNYVRRGYSFSEIANILGFSKSYIYKIKNEYTKENDWFTTEEIAEFKKKRKINEYEDLPLDIKEKMLEIKKQEEKKAKEIKRKREANRQDRVNQTKKKHQEDLEIIKKYLLLGYEYSEIAKILDKSVEYVYKLKYESMDAGTWLTGNEIKIAEKKKIKRREKKAQKLLNEKKKAKEKRIKERNEANQKIKMNTLYTLRDLTTQGLSINEIARKNALFK